MGGGNNEVNYWSAFNFIQATNPSNWHVDFLKWVLLALCEPKGSSEEIHIEKGLCVLKQENNELCNGIVNSELSKVSNLLEKCCNWRSSARDDRRRDSIIREIIYDNLRLEEPFASSLVRCLLRLQVLQRSVLRFMVHQNIQARIAFTRTTLKADQYPVDAAAGYHCTFNPYYIKIRNEHKKIADEKEEIDKKYKDIVDEKEEIDKKYKDIVDENEKINEKYKKLLDDNNASRSLLIEMNDENESLRNKSEEQSKNLEKSKRYKEKIKRLKEETTQLKERMKKSKNNYDNEIKQSIETQNSLIHELDKAKKDISCLQSALGDATNVRVSDKSLNSPLQIIKDIEKLKQLLDDFSKTKGKSIKINESKAKELFLEYEIKINKNISSTSFKSILASNLQRLVIFEIFSAAEKIKDNDRETTTDNNHLEPLIIHHTNKLIKCTTELYQNRQGSDIVSKTTPIKIRQQVYETLALRGFSKSNHPYVIQTMDKIIRELDKYRDILDEERRNSLTKDAEELVRFGFRLWFGLQAQEPIPKIKWYSQGKPIEPHLMQGAWDREEISNYEVELCYFPSIASGEIGDLQIYNKSEVLTRPKTHGTFGKLRNGVMNIVYTNT